MSLLCVAQPLNKQSGQTPVPATWLSLPSHTPLAHPPTLIFLALCEHDDNGEQRPIGIAVCFFGFSTFLARPLMNIHDLHVVAEVQGRGIGRRLLKAVEEKSHALDCRKLTLEVQENNRPALRLYHRSGFDEGVYEMEAGKVLFRQNPL